MSRTSGRLAVLATLAAAALVLTACGGSPAAPRGKSDSASDPDASLTVGLVLAPASLDIRHGGGAAVEQLLIDNVYEGLVTRNEKNEVIPRLATKYDVSPDGLTYTFTLAKDVTFHNGDALTAEDVVASFDAVKSDESLQGTSDFATVTSITAPDAESVVLTLSAPNQNFLFTLTGPGGIVLKKGDTTDLKTAENGTGPFQITDWVTETSATLTRFDDYWGTAAGVAEVNIMYIPDFSAGVSTALDGTLDVLTAVLPELSSQLEDSGDFTLTRGLTTDKATLAFNNAAAPLNDVRVREAIRLAIDHDALVEANGGGTTLYGPIPELDPGYEDLSSLVPHDPEKAKKLLAEAGQENVTLTLTIPNFYGTTTSQILVSDLAKVGITLKVNAVPFETWLNDVYTNHNYQLSYVLHVEPRDIENFANPKYYFGYNNPEVQKLYTEALAELDADASAQLLAKAARLISEDHAADWLYNGDTITAVRPNVTGFPQNSVNARMNLAPVKVTSD